MHTCSTLYEDVHVVLGLSCHYLFSAFCTFSTYFVFSCDTMIRVACGYNFSYSFIPNFLKLCMCFIYVWRCAYAFGVTLPSFFFFFFLSTFFHFFDVGFQVLLVLEWYLVGATYPTVFHPSFLNYVHLFYMIWRYACGFGVILSVFLSTFSTLFLLSFFPVPISTGTDTLWA